MLGLGFETAEPVVRLILGRGGGGGEKEGRGDCHDASTELWGHTVCVPRTKGAHIGCWG